MHICEVLLMRTGQILNTFFILRLAYWTVERNTIIITMSEWFSKTHWYFQVLYVIHTMNQNHIFFFTSVTLGIGEILKFQYF